MDIVLTLLQVIAAGLAFLLAGLAIGAATRYGDRRFGLIGGGLISMGAVSVVGVLNQVNFVGGAEGMLGYLPTGLLLVAEILLYLSLSLGPSTLPSELDGRAN